MNRTDHRTRQAVTAASESACTIGGVVASNSSVACGAEFNIYRTLDCATWYARAAPF